MARRNEEWFASVIDPRLHSKWGPDCLVAISESAKESAIEGEHIYHGKKARYSRTRISKKMKRPQRDRCHANDDRRHRKCFVASRTRQLVWRWGHKNPQHAKRGDDGCAFDKSAQRTAPQQSRTFMGCAPMRKCSSDCCRVCGYCLPVSSLSLTRGMSPAACNLR